MYHLLLYTLSLYICIYILYIYMYMCIFRIIYIYIYTPYSLIFWVPSHGKSEVYTWPTGVRFVGQYQNNLKHGWGLGGSWLCLFPNQGGLAARTGSDSRMGKEAVSDTSAQNVPSSYTEESAESNQAQSALTWQL